MDDLTRKRPEDPTKININQQWEIDYWTKELSISETKLIALVNKVGPEVSKVKAELRLEKIRSNRDYDGFGY